LTWIIALSLLFLFSKYYEIILWGVMYDAIYGIPLNMFWGIPYIFSILSITLLSISFIFRKNLLVYET